MALSTLVALLQDAPAADNSGQRTVQLIAGALAVLLVVIIIMRRKRGKKKEEEEEF